MSKLKYPGGRREVINRNIEIEVNWTLIFKRRSSHILHQIYLLFQVFHPPTPDIRSTLFEFEQHSFSTALSSIRFMP